MPTGEQVAYALCSYDRRVAELVTQLIARELGIEEPDLDRLHACLSGLYDDGADKTTREWKLSLGQHERLRSLAIALTALLAEPSGREP